MPSGSEHPVRPRRLTCARCGAAFDCALAPDCWCAGLAPLSLPAAASAQDCLCPACLRSASAGR
ncbi:MAG TPA: cysteine-rich CWC family protein [Xanthobacteraceae bacterium]